MAAPRCDGRFAAAAAEAKRVVRRAGAAWNKHDAACLNDALRMAVGHELPCVLAEYGGLRLRFDMLHGQAKLSTFCHGADAQGGGHGDDVMEDSRSETAGQQTHDDAVAKSRHGKKAPWQEVEPVAAADVAAAMDVDASDEVARLRRKEDTRREAKRRQRQNKRARKAEAKATAAKAAEAAKLAAAPSPGFTIGGGQPPGLNPAAPTFVFGVASGTASPSELGRCEQCRRC